jgi:hypothetical protein
MQLSPPDRQLGFTPLSLTIHPGTPALRAPYYSPEQVLADVGEPKVERVQATNVGLLAER